MRAATTLLGILAFSSVLAGCSQVGTRTLASSPSGIPLSKTYRATPAFVPVSAAAQTSPGDDRLQFKLNSHSALRGARIEVEYNSKETMVMRGTVVSSWQKRRASEIVRKLTRIPVSNELRVSNAAQAQQRR